MSSRYTSHVDPFVGTEPFDQPPSEGLAARWWLPKPPIGNTHPGACFPLGMVSACAHSGAYPTGYGRYGRSTEGIAAALFPKLQVNGFTHFHQSGTGAIRKYYNYFRVVPLARAEDTLDSRWDIVEEQAKPGYYRAVLSGSEVTAELSVGQKVAVHRYRFRPGQEARLLVDFSSGGLCIPRARSVPTHADLELLGGGEAQGTVLLEGVPISAHLRVAWAGCSGALWYGDAPVAGGRRMVFDHIRETTLRPFGVVFQGKAPQSGVVELVLGFSMRGARQARENAQWTRNLRFDEVRDRASSAWHTMLSKIQVDEGPKDRLCTFYTALYHSLIKPCFAENESPFWPHEGPFVFDICTMWDIYKTQIPLLCLLAPKRAASLLDCLLRISEQEGNFPIGYRMVRGSDRFFRQASALAHTALADANALGLSGIDWERALVQMHNDLSRTYGEDFLDKGVVHPLTHTLDLAYGCFCTAKVARAVGDAALARNLDQHAANWIRAYDKESGLLADSTYYEGTKHNYSYRLLHDMSARIALSGGDAAFVQQLDRFFGVGAGKVEQLRHPPFGDAIEKGYALGRFEGLNNEPDMEAPYAYHYAGRPDRSADVVREARTWQFGVGRGGLPGNDDSGGLSSWYVWASLGIFPVAGQNLFLITPPEFERSRIQAPGGCFEIVCRHRSETCKYISRAMLNDKEVSSYITGNQLHAGGQLVLEFSDCVSDWGRTNRPPSVSSKQTTT